MLRTNVNAKTNTDADANANANAGHPEDDVNMNQEPEEIQQAALTEEEWLMTKAKIEPGINIYKFSTDPKMRRFQNIQFEEGKPKVPTMIFFVTTPDKPNRLQKLSITSKTLVNDIKDLLDRNITDIQIERKGTGKRDTEYTVSPLSAGPPPHSQKQGRL